MSIAVNLFSLLFFFFLVFGLQAARAFSFFGIQPNLFLISLGALTLLLPRGGRGFLFFLLFQGMFLFLLFLFFPFFLFETAGLFALFSLLFLVRKFFSGTFGADFFLFIFLGCGYFVLLGFGSFSLQFFLASFSQFFFTFVFALLFWYVGFVRGALPRGLLHP
ncbi:MAG: hypothetical protein AAB634_02700 [Patescibacteria group bacterium]